MDPFGDYGRWQRIGGWFGLLFVLFVGALAMPTEGARIHISEILYSVSSLLLAAASFVYWCHHHPEANQISVVINGLFRELVFPASPLPAKKAAYVIGGVAILLMMTGGLFSFVAPPRSPC